MVPFSTGDQHSWNPIPCCTLFVHILMAARGSGWPRSCSRDTSPVQKAKQTIQTVLFPGRFNALSFSISPCPQVPAQDTHYSCQLFGPPLCESSDEPAQNQKQTTSCSAVQSKATLRAVPEALVGELLTSCIVFSCLHQDPLSKSLEISLQLNSLRDPPQNLYNMRS